MSAVQTSARYRALERDFFPWQCRFAVVDDDAGDFSPLTVDYFQTRSGAEYAARLLNSGVAVVNSHGTLGCRVEVK